ncbi:hypothetical protein [Embleya sp. NPDC020630]|uniref:hypothetical protein n=1 Tax=Embleya sp. NPDC020630 TaxID=3363979 RepID=UPI0037B7CBF4
MFVSLESVAVVASAIAAVCLSLRRPGMVEIAAESHRLIAGKRCGRVCRRWYLPPGAVSAEAALSSKNTGTDTPTVMRAVDPQERRRW